jgi:cytochrome P450
VPNINRASSRPDTASSLAFDASDEAVWTDPDGLLRQLRAEDPVHWSEPEQAWILTRHTDALAVLRDDRTFVTDGRAASGRAGDLVRGVDAQSPLPYDSMLSSAGREDHARLRRSAAAAFAPDSVEALRQPIRELASALLGSAPRAELDAIGEFARPLSLAVTLHLLGVEMSETARVARLAELLMSASQFGDGAPDHGSVNLVAARAEFGAMVEQLEVSEGSLIASLRAARDAGTLSDDDLVALVVFIATVGQAPTAFASGNALLALLRNPDQLAALRADRTLLANVIDEAARFDPPLRVIRRFATLDTEFGGRTIRAGDMLQLIVAATNRDPAAFAEPNRFDLKRGDRTHLSFGWASHHCLGAPVARVIAEESLALLLDAFPVLVASGHLELLAGEIAGPTALGVLGRAGTPPAHLEAARTNDIASISVAAVPSNHACPCGSGRKYKRCHASK